MKSNLPRFCILLLTTLTCWFVTQLSAQQEGREWAEAGKVQGADKILAKCAPNTKVQDTVIPMRDGVKLATTVFLPPGQGPFPVIFVRSPYGRLGLSAAADPCKKGEFVYVTQDQRGKGTSEGKGSFDPASFTAHIKDTEDTLAWIAKQTWCNGKIGMTGGSGNGIGPYTAFLSGSPHLTVSAPSNSSGHAWYWSYDNGVRRNLYKWMEQNGLSVKSYPRPTLAPQKYEEVQKELESHKIHPETVLIAYGGWFDIVSESAIDMFTLFSKKTKVYAVMSPTQHTGAASIEGKKFNTSGRPKSPPAYDSILKSGKAPADESYLAYYLMGEAGKSGGAGNVWKITSVWPVPHKVVPYYFKEDGTLTPDKPSAGKRNYTYDPKDPAPSFGGNVTYGTTDGPSDQRPLKDRKDVLRFASNPIEKPVIITGKIKADLYITTTAEDTAFVIKFVDIYPSGYEALIRETAVMGRYAEGLDGKTPLQNGKVYHLKADLWSTALAVDTGHRIGVYVTSSSAFKNKKNELIETYEVHPNTFAPVKSIGESKVAEQILHLGGDTPSAILLPIVHETKSSSQ